MASIGGRRVRRTRKGDYELKLPEGERALMGSLVNQLRAVLAEGGSTDPSVRRLFPTAYPEDAERDAEYKRMVTDDLLVRRRSALETVETTLEKTRLDEDELLAWMGAVNDMRLVLGTRLDVSEETDLTADPDDPDAAALAVYTYLGFLLETIVDALGR